MTERQITALERMSSAALKAEWERLTGTPAPRISPSMMRLALAFEWRSRARGGYSRRLIDDRGSRPSAEVDPSVVRLLAQAHRWWRILRDEPPQWWWHRSRSPAWHVGACISMTLVHQLERSTGKRGIATLCIGIGVGLVLAVERV